MAPTVRCAGCGTRSGGNFCRQCGQALAREPNRRRERGAWLAATVLTAAAVASVALLMARGAPTPVVPSMSNPGSEVANVNQAPSLEGQPQRARFDQLFDRLMRAGSEGDSASVAKLTPLALEAYAQLDSTDADARFHAGLIAIQTGNFPGAQALADTLEWRDPGHLFGPILLGALARLQDDSVGFRKAIELFRARAGRELARTDRPEYLEHRQLLADIQLAAETK